MDDLNALAKITKNARKMIEYIGDAAGVYFEPGRILRKARAEGEAIKILAQSKIEAKDFEINGLETRLRQAGMEQKNIENILCRAILELEASEKDYNIEAVSKQWIVEFIDNSKHAVEDELRQLWADVLVNETRKNGSFSRRSLRSIRYIEKRDALLFEKVCSRIWVFESKSPIIFETEIGQKASSLITFDDLKHLDSIGLVYTNDVTGLNMTLQPGRFKCQYHNSVYVIQNTKETELTLPIGVARFTQLGRELSILVERSFSSTFENLTVDNWRKAGWLVNKVSNGNREPIKGL